MITLDEAIEILSRPKTMKGTPQDILEAHDMAITALRQPEIIRCRNCRYWEREKPFATSGRCFIWECANRKGSDYCSEARRIANG